MLISSIYDSTVIVLSNDELQIDSSLVLLDQVSFFDIEFINTNLRTCIFSGYRHF
jgi:hypothetical protein